MSKRDLLLEIGLEEMPARFVTSSIQQLTDKIQKWFKNKKIAFGEVSSFSTPRRLAVLIKNVDESQDDIHEEVKGPAKKIALDSQGNWTKAASGFSRGQGMSVEDIYFKEINGVEYAYVEKFVKGVETASLLPELEHIVTSLTFPKNMRWGNEKLRYIRPIKWLIAMFGENTIPFSIANVETSNWSQGHRFLGKRIEIPSPDKYEEILLSQYVIANAQDRKKAILSQLNNIEEKNDWKIPIDEDLLEEVNNLVEYPTALYGKFEEEFLELPEEVLITSMKEHQRYFPVKSIDGKLLPYFVTVRNGNEEHLEKVAKGNEKVLRARLADASFFYKEDQKKNIADCLAKLETIVYHEEIGTLAEKVRRVRRLTNELTSLLPLSEMEKKEADRAAEICKFDLVTHMVYEFPELQGFMGEKYAAQKGEKPGVAQAINEHYMPRNAEDSLPESNAGAILAIADKLDTISSFFAIGNIPSGSQDPYALRRQATGIVQILNDKNWNIELEELIRQALHFIIDDGIPVNNVRKLENELLSFFKLRLKYLLQERGIRHDVIDAILGNKVGIISSLVRKADVLQSKLEEDDFKEKVEALSRIINISNKAANFEKEINPRLFENDSEHNLYHKYKNVSDEISRDIPEEKYYELLVSMQEEINDYFECTMVMAEDETIRDNRLTLMVKLAQLIKKFADFNEIIVK